MQQTYTFEYADTISGKKIIPVQVGVTPHAAGNKKVVWIRGTEPGIDEYLSRKVERILKEGDTCSTCLQSDGISMRCLHPLNLKCGVSPLLSDPEKDPNFVCPNHDDFDVKAKAFLAANPDFFKQFKKPEDGYFPLMEELRKQAAMEAFLETMKWAFQHGKGGMMVM